MSNHFNSKVQVLTNTRLIDITTPLQSKRGNRSFICEKTGCIYTSYASGAIRRSKVYDTQYTAVISENNTRTVFNRPKHSFNRLSYRLNRNVNIKSALKRHEEILYYADLHASKYSNYSLI